jgi:anti-sigma regulatory factor (Ser/Thr protein kinase)
MTTETSRPDYRRSTEPRLQHEAFLYAGEREFHAGALPFIRDGIEAGEPVLVVLRADKAERLRARLDGDADEVYWAEPRQASGHRPERFIPGWNRYLHRRPGGQVRGLGERGRLPTNTAELIDVQRYESLLDLAFAGSRSFSLLCPYDTDVVDPTTIDRARESHQVTLHRGTRSQVHGNPPPDDYGAHPLPDSADVLQLFMFDAGQLSQVRRIVDGYAARLGLGGSRTYDYVLAVDEVAANSIRHGGGTGILRVWRKGGCLTSEIRDRGVIDSHPTATDERPPTDQKSGRGLWLVHQLCDLVQTRSTPSEGTLTRLHISRT